MRGSSALSTSGISFGSKSVAYKVDRPGLPKPDARNRYPWPSGQPKPFKLLELWNRFDPFGDHLDTEVFARA
jgi:hypothetical protein